METLSDQFFKADKIFIYNNGTQTEVDKTTIFNELKKMLEKSYFSPALGVSIHEHTVKEMQKGYWIEFVYNDIQTFAEMPYNKLLIELKPDYYGFNIIRNFNDLYTGRCYYLNLFRPSTEFYKFIEKFLNSFA